MNCKNCGAPPPADGANFCAYCGSQVVKKIKRRVVRSDMGRFENLVNVELVGDMNRVTGATNCVIRGDMNRVTGADADTQVVGDMNRIRRAK